MFECFDCRATFRDQFPDDPDGPQFCQACGSERLIPRDDLEIETVAEALELHPYPDELDEAVRRDEERQFERHRHQ